MASDFWQGVGRGLSGGVRLELLLPLLVQARERREEKERLRNFGEALVEQVVQTAGTESPFTESEAAMQYAMAGGKLSDFHRLMAARRAGQRGMPGGEVKAGTPEYRQMLRGAREAARKKPRRPTLFENLMYRLSGRLPAKGESPARKAAEALGATEPAVRLGGMLAKTLVPEVAPFVEPSGPRPSDILAEEEERRKREALLKSLPPQPSPFQGGLMGGWRPFLP